MLNDTENVVDPDEERHLHILDKPLDKEDIVYAYRYLLGREHESPDSLAYWLATCQTLGALREAFLGSTECREALLQPYVQGNKWVAVETDLTGQIWLDLNDQAVSVPIFKGGFEANETAYFQSLLRPDSVFVDVGANLGWYTLVASQHSGKGVRVSAFEPHPVIAKYLRRSITANGLNETVRVHETALDELAGSAVFGAVLDTHNLGHSWFLTEAETSKPEQFSQWKVQRARLDDVALIGAPTIMKIDVEGAERRVIEGARQTLLTHKPVVIMELFPAQLQRISECSAETLIQLMAELGYEAFEIENGALGKPLVRFPTERNIPLLSAAFHPKT